MTMRVALAMFVIVTGAGTTAARPGPTAPGPHLVGHTRITVTRPGTPGIADRRLDPVVWYPADVRGEPEDAFGYVDPAVAAGRHPLLVYSHGGCAYPGASSFLNRALASRGFVVVAPTHPGDTIFDGLDTCDFVELRATTLVGFRAVLSLAPDARPERIGTRPVGAPTMVMEGELDFYDPQQTALDQAYGILRPPRFAVELRRTGHFAFSDVCVADLIGGDDCAPGTLTQDEAHRVVLRFAVPFLMRWVAGEKAWDKLLRPATVANEDGELRAERRRSVPRIPY